MLANADLGEFDDYGEVDLEGEYQARDPGLENVLDSSYMQMKQQRSTKGSQKPDAGSLYAPYAAGKSGGNAKKAMKPPPKFVQS